MRKALVIHAPVLLIIFLFYCFNLAGCRQPNRQIEERLKEFIGTEVIIPESLFLFNDRYNLINRGAKYKIISYIDSLDCTSCYLNQSAKMWSNLLNIFKNDSFSLFIILHTQDIEGIQSIFESSELDLPFFVDFYGEFKNSNQIPPETILHTFLLRNDTVILVGAPSDNSKLLELYKQEILKD